MLLRKCSADQVIASEVIYDFPFSPHLNPLPSGEREGRGGKFRLLRDFVSRNDRKERISLNIYDKTVRFKEATIWQRFI